MAEFEPLGLGGLHTRSTLRKAADRLASRNYERHELLPPPKPHRNYVPSQEAIDALLERAIAALMRGMIWDRGSIVNLVL